MKRSGMVKMVLCCMVSLMVVMLGFGLFKFHRVKKDPDAAMALLPENTDISLNQIHQISTRDGIKEWSLDADTVRFQKKENRSVLSNVSVTFFLKDGGTVHVTGTEGVFLTDTKDIEIWGDVVVRYGQYTLRTEKLTYGHKTRSVHTETPILLEGEGVFLSGNNMTFSFADEQVIVGGGVETKVTDFVL